VGSEVDTIIPFMVARPHADPPSLMAQHEPVFITRACRPVRDTFVLLAAGCGTLTIDTLAVQPPTSKFSLGHVKGTPFDLHGIDSIITIYDPDGTGGDSAELIVTSSNGAISFHEKLHGSVSGPIPSARCMMDLDGAKSETVRAGSNVAITLTALDPIPDSLGLASISYELIYDGNLLTKVKVT